MLGAFCHTNFSHNHDKKKSFKSSREEIGLRCFKELLRAEARRCSREEQDKQEANLGDFWECRGFATGEWLRKEWCSYRLRDIWMVFYPRFRQHHLSCVSSESGSPLGSLQGLQESAVKLCR